MREIRQLAEADLDAFVTILGNAYPDYRLASEADRRAVKEQLVANDADPTIDMYGLFEDGALLGGMRLFDFTMTLYETHTLVGGVGSVAVDLQHKKEKVARDLIAYFVRHYRARGAALTALYPFRPDFYHAMGYGYATKSSAYRVPPAALPGQGAREHVRLLGAEDRPLLLDCYARYATRTHGMMQLSETYAQRYFSNPEVRVVGYQDGEQLTGFMVFRFEKVRDDNFLLHDVVTRELIYESPEALLGLLAFLRTQADQVRYVALNLQDDSFHYLLADPRDGTDNLIPFIAHESNTQGVGLMYRVVDTRRLFAVLADHDFGGQTCAVRLRVADSFLPENDGGVTVRFAGGRPRLEDEGAGYDVEVGLSVADFSSLALGCVDLRDLYNYGLATVSDSAYVAVLDRLFRAERRPVCVTGF